MPTFLASFDSHCSTVAVLCIEIQRESISSFCYALRKTLHCVHACKKPYHAQSCRKHSGNTTELLYLDFSGEYCSKSTVAANAVCCNHEQSSPIHHCLEMKISLSLNHFQLVTARLNNTTQAVHSFSCTSCTASLWEREIYDQLAKAIFFLGVMRVHVLPAIELQSLTSLLAKTTVCP